MTTKLNTIFILFFCCTFLWTINSCTKKPAVGLDLELYEMAKDTAGFVWFMHTDSLLDKTPGSTHSQPYIRTRFNAIAATKLDSKGAIVAGAKFPVGSLVVKEMFSEEKILKAYTVLYKKPGSIGADDNGWIWGAVRADGIVEISALKKGSDCAGCHLQPGNIDYMLMNKCYQ